MWTLAVKATNPLHGPLALTLGYPISNATKLVHFLMICSIMEDQVVVLCNIGLLNKWHMNNKIIILASSFGNYSKRYTSARLLNYYHSCKYLMYYLYIIFDGQT